jgi:hypothetical protein
VLAILQFAIILVAGVGLMFTRWTIRAVAVGGLVVLLVFVGVFLPTFAHQTAHAVPMAAAFIVAVLWTLWYFLVTRPRDPDLRARREARRAALASLFQRRHAVPATAAPAATPAAPAAPPSDAGTPPSPPPPPAPPTPPAAGDKKKKGGGPHA